MRHVIVRHVPSPDPADVDGLRHAGVATTHEAMGRSGLMKPYMRPIIAGAQVAGRAITVLTTPGDNWIIQAAIEWCGPGDILVVAVNAECSDGMLGDMLSTALMARGVRAVVLDAGCRDVRTLREMNFPVWSKAVSAQGTVKAALGAVNVPVVCAGALVRPGDVVVADDDGVVIVPRLAAGKVVAAARTRTEREEALRSRLAAGQALAGFEASRGRLAELGMVYLDRDDEAI